LTSKGDSIIQTAVLSPLATWQNFYVITGTAAATLTGLMFVVVTLIAGRRLSPSPEVMATFNTPSIVHFCATLLVTALLCAPWQALWNASLLLGLCGLAGIIYVIVIARRARHLPDYQPVLEDWLWHTIFPFVSYTTFFVAAITLPANPVPTLFYIGAAMLLLLFIGIHNAWDNLTYVITYQPQSQKESQDEEKCLPFD
jgi:hypothetical protein